jgi:hypothetical protein
MKPKSLFKSAAIALTIVTLSGIPAGSLDSIASASITLDRHLDQDEKAIKVIEDSIEALGGKEAIIKNTTVTQSGTMSVPSMGLEGTIELYIDSPSRLRLILDLPMMGKTIQGLNDGVVWSTDAMGGPRILPADEAKELIEQADIGYLLRFRENYTTIEYVAQVEFDGQTAHKLRLVDHEGNETIEYYAVESKFQIGLESQPDTPMGKIKSVTKLQDYKELGGVLQVTRIVQAIGPTEVVISFDNADYSEIDDSVFELPAAIKALMEAKKEDAAP